MALKEDILSKIKGEEKQALLLSYMKTYKIRNVNTLKKSIDNNIMELRTLMQSTRFYGTVNHKRKEYAKKLEYFTEIKKLAGRL